MAELAALNIPISVTGAQGALVTFQGLDRAGKQVAASMTAATGQAGVFVARGLTPLASQATKAGGSTRALARQMAGLALSQVGLQGSLGRLITTLGFLTAGSGLMLGVTAALTAIAVLFERMTRASRDAARRVKEFREESQKLIGQTLTLQEQLAEAQAAEQRAEEIKAEADAQVLLTQKRLDDLEAQQRQLGLNAKQRAESRFHLEAERAVVKAIADRADATRELRAHQRFRLDLERQISEETRRAAEAASAAFREETQTLIGLAGAGVATSRDLERLRSMLDQIAAASRVGSAEFRLWAAEVLKAANAAGQFTTAQRTFLIGALAPAKPKTGVTPKGPQAVSGEAPRAPETGIPLEDIEAAARRMGVSVEEVQAALIRTGKSLPEIEEQFTSLTGALQTGADAFVGFWESVGAGEGVDKALRHLIANSARVLAQYFAAMALGGIAKALILGDTKALAGVAKAAAAAAAFAALAGSLGGGGGGDGGGGGAGDRGHRLDLKNTEQEVRVAPRLLHFGAVPTSTTSQLKPEPAVHHHWTVIGPNDPVAQNAIMRIVEQGKRRGLGR